MENIFIGFQFFALIIFELLPTEDYFQNERKKSENSIS